MTYDSDQAGAMVHANVYDMINERYVIEDGLFPADWDDALIKSAVSIDRWGNAKSAFAYRVDRTV